MTKAICDERSNLIFPEKLVHAMKFVDGDFHLAFRVSAVELWRKDVIKQSIVWLKVSTAFWNNKESTLKLIMLATYLDQSISCCPAVLPASMHHPDRPSPAALLQSHRHCPR